MTLKLRDKNHMTLKLRDATLLTPVYSMHLHAACIQSRASSNHPNTVAATGGTVLIRICYGERKRGRKRKVRGQIYANV